MLSKYRLEKMSQKECDPSGSGFLRLTISDFAG